MHRCFIWKRIARDCCNHLLRGWPLKQDCCSNQDRRRPERHAARWRALKALGRHVSGQKELDVQQRFEKLLKLLHLHCIQKLFALRAADVVLDDVEQVLAGRQRARREGVLDRVQRLHLCLGQVIPETKRERMMWS